MKIKLPKGLRIQVVDDTNLICPVGTKATLTWDETLDTNSFATGVMCVIDGESFSAMLPFSQCEIITDNFKKTLKHKS